MFTILHPQSRFYFPPPPAHQRRQAAAVRKPMPTPLPTTSSAAPPRVSMQLLVAFGGRPRRNAPAHAWPIAFRRTVHWHAAHHQECRATTTTHVMALNEAELEEMKQLLEVAGVRRCPGGPSPFIQAGHGVKASCGCGQAVPCFFLITELVRNARAQPIGSPKLLFACVCAAQKQWLKENSKMTSRSASL